ncbi:Threonine/homoserine/homoserine lactone efflux protein [Roseivivax halotolerans]|uniref:Threonine/homoserine/homoserine lactone efflux protein n=1 Tax=Roseivivax halotolerans TaxID=93684 RepID=A0A1I5VH04_9RHOB|nr:MULTISPECIES: LysE family translocator [Roseivivax]QFT61299.1 Leucine efflux protein [Roseivivax sp. THAF30]SFQ06824.1 Threonine/homoserine/homoserine lactone efflux protein [Roseivivax halotolerans]
MTLTASDLLLYSGALLILFLTPGPVWVALVARALSGGFNAAWPLALGVVVGDVLWPFLAILGVSWIVSVYGGFIDALRWIAAATFLIMGALILKNANADLSRDSRLTRPGMWAGFLAGLAVIIGNPKAILFYMGMLPGFFDVSRVTWADMAVISLISAAVPLFGNLMLALSIDRVKRLLSSPEAVRRTNIVAGCLLIGVGFLIPFT